MKSLENKTARIFDIFFCLVFMPLLVVLGPARRWIVPWPLFFITVQAFLYGCYFAVNALRVPQLVIEKRYKRIAAAFAVLIAVCWLLTLYPLPDMDFVTPSLSEYQTRVRNYSISLSIWLMFSAVMALALTVSFVKELYAQLLLKRMAENERDKAELAVFKAQISPHFLFNTLNSLYSLVVGTSEKAEDAFIKFTDMLKYTYMAVGRDTVLLRDEIKYISDYIDLQKLRLNEHTRIEWNSRIDDEEVSVPPMLLLTFVENAFKYGASTARDCTIGISLALDAGTLVFETRNAIMKHADSFRSEIPVGIANSRARLAALFPGRHSLDTEQTESEFYLKMTIML